MLTDRYDGARDLLKPSIPNAPHFQDVIDTGSHLRLTTTNKTSTKRQRSVGKTNRSGRSHLSSTGGQRHGRHRRPWPTSANAPKDPEVESKATGRCFPNSQTGETSVRAMRKPLARILFGRSKGRKRDPAICQARSGSSLLRAVATRGRGRHQNRGQIKRYHDESDPSDRKTVFDFESAAARLSRVG